MASGGVISKQNELVWAVKCKIITPLSLIIEEHSMVLVGVFIVCTATLVFTGYAPNVLTRQTELRDQYSVFSFLLDFQNDNVLRITGNHNVLSSGTLFNLRIPLSNLILIHTMI